MKTKKKDLLDRWLEDKDNTAYFSPIDNEEICVVTVRPKEIKPITYEESLEEFRKGFSGWRMS